MRQGNNLNQTALYCASVFPLPWKGEMLQNTKHGGGGGEWKLGKFTARNKIHQESLCFRGGAQEEEIWSAVNELLLLGGLRWESLNFPPLAVN